ncbi:UBC-like protein [Microstroma glucosiphilum]|uniref:UBC-like protein n=1 Tax=Pseudomicrostroma glucosiphilum TaxID=1684307 RepID=A0A316U5D9_9BASI|nr:UBC-like protein [Pseudomicrostroma glucosiphilum]PWN20054.1 UBC-like protein [Pseudomicrostroma glucosiphilum]
MATTTSHNKKSSAVKRILSEARELEADGSDEYEARPLESNIFEWHFTLRGPSGTEFEEGLYHGRVLLPVEYPFRPPDLMLLTPNGRWECNKKICLTFTGYHESMWQPAWGIRTALLGVQGFMSARAEAATGVASVDYPIEERIRLAKKSRGWTCSDCGKSNVELLPDGDPDKSRKKEELPEGLVVDAAGGKGGEHAEGGTEAAGSGLAAQASQSQAMAASPSEQGQGVASASAMLASVSSELPQAISSSSLAATALPDDGGSSASLLPADQSMQREASSTSRHSMPSASSGSSTLSGDQPKSTPAYRGQVTNQSPAPTPPQPRAHSSSLSPLQRAPPPPPSSQSQHSPRLQAPQPPPLSIPPPTPATLRPVPPGGPDTSPDGQPLPPLPLIRRGVPAEDLPAPRRPTRSEARVAQLDRAILTVVLLLCGLVVRRLI